MMSTDLNKEDTQESVIPCDDGSLVASLGAFDIRRATVEELQKRQSDVQEKLDEVLAVAEKLEKHQRRRLNLIFEEDKDQNKRTTEIGTSLDDDELLEFQQIENELRISELNRQLDHIQGEIRTRLLNRLLSNTNSEHVGDRVQADSDVWNNKQQELYSSPITNSEMSNSSSSSIQTPSSKQSTFNNRPLTLYTPRSNEDIDLVEHIQALGHDLSIVHRVLKVDRTTARGYLWKRSLNKKWLLRYFLFDRTNRVLSYYESESQLVKEPRVSIPLEAICDVYVDHRIKKRRHIFVVATTFRRYHLASSAAEAMRCWIDIFSTVARANDEYYQPCIGHIRESSNVV